MSDAIQPRTLKRFGIGAGIVAIAIVMVGISTRGAADRRLEATAAEAAVPTVDVVSPTKGEAGGGIVLPGSIQAYNSAAIFARTNGYIRNWLADIGDEVRAGQTLAVLDAPEVDQQLAQAQADYQTALANQSLARTTATRWSTMLARDAVSRQEADEKAGDLAAKSALANAARANVNRLRALQGFTRLTAPFGGVVTSRSAQIGALVASGNAAAQPLFTVSDVHRVRIYVRVPQAVSAQVHQGMHATMTLPEYPGRSFDAVLRRSADAVDVQSGTVLVELQADNADRALKPGAYAQVTFPIGSAAGSVRVPASALIFHESGPTVAIVGANGRVRMIPVTVGRDEGKEIEILAGLTGRERIVDTPPDALETGDPVRINAARANAGAARARG